MNDCLLQQIALTLVPNIGCVQAKILLQHMDISEVFTARKSTLERIEGLGVLRAKNIRDFRDFDQAEKEIAFIEKNGITPLFITDENYPQRLLNCYDPPTLLFYKGSANLNQSKILAVVGTRSNTDYGRKVTETLMQDLSGTSTLIVSGLAYGIDSLAHKSALKNRLETVGVLAHGLDKIYPQVNSGLARDMVSQGGLLTEFRKDTIPDRYNFPSRNRIVAGMSDATLVIETEIKGGSMITAELANGYNRDVFAYPGRTTDKKSSGCNFLIQHNKAMLMTDTQSMLETLGWKDPSEKPTRKKSRELFIELSPSEKIVFDIIGQKEQTDIDEIQLNAGLPVSEVAMAILNLEIQQIVESLPGKMYRIL